MVLQCQSCETLLFSVDHIVDSEDGHGVLCVECAVQEEAEEEVVAGE